MGEGSVAFRNWHVRYFHIWDSSCCCCCCWCQLVYRNGNDKIRLLVTRDQNNLPKKLKFRRWWVTISRGVMKGRGEKFVSKWLLDDVKRPRPRPLHFFDFLVSDLNIFVSLSLMVGLLLCAASIAATVGEVNAVWNNRSCSVCGTTVAGNAVAATVDPGRNGSRNRCK